MLKYLSSIRYDILHHLNTWNTSLLFLFLFFNLFFLHYINGGTSGSSIKSELFSLGVTSFKVIRLPKGAIFDSLDAFLSGTMFVTSTPFLTLASTSRKLLVKKDNNKMKIKLDYEMKKCCGHIMLIL